MAGNLPDGVTQSMLDSYYGYDQPVCELCGENAEESKVDGKWMCPECAKQHAEMLDKLDELEQQKEVA
jgi:ribosomal protein L37AE/L43A